MKTERGKPDYPTPTDLCRVVSAICDGRERLGPYYVLNFIAPAEMEAMRARNEGIMGTPTLVSVYSDRLWLWPTPDDAYTVEVRYETPLKRF